MKKSMFSLLVLVLITFTACEKSDKDKDYLKDKDKKETCFDLTYPISYTMPDGSTDTYNDEDAMWTGLKSWYNTNPDATSKPTLNYPVNLTFKDGTTKSIANDNEMVIVKKWCAGDKKETCFDLTYPISYTMPDGSTDTYNDEDAMWTGLKSWYNTNPDATSKPTLNYPVNLTFKDGTTKSIANDNEMKIAKKDCWTKEKMSNKISKQ